MRPPESSRSFRLGLPAGFVAGLIVGLLLGWVFHGVVGLFVRLGFALLLLIPLALVVWFFVLRGRLRSGDSGDGSGRMQVYTWRGGQGAGHSATDAPPPPRRGEPLDENPIDVEFEELKRQVEDEGTRR